MATRPTKKTAAKKPTKKNPYDPTTFKKEMGIDETSQKMKPITWLKFSDGYNKALGVPGIPIGFGSQFIGFSDTGKSTAMYEAVVAAQKIGTFPIIVDTEGNWSWDYAKSVGIEFEEFVNDSGDEDVRGDFLFFQDYDLVSMYEKFDYKAGKMTSKPLRTVAVIEDVARLFNEFADKVLLGQLERDVLFIWDSVGTVDCFASVQSLVGNNQWNAGVMKRAFQSFFKKITRTRRIDFPYNMSIASVNKVWLDNSNMHPIVKQAGGEAWRFYNRFIVHTGGKTTSSAARKEVQADGQVMNFGVETAIEVIKNQINGLSNKKAKICSTPHGFVHPDDLTKYKADNKAYFQKLLGVGSDAELSFTTIEATDKDPDFEENDMIQIQDEDV